jgi:uncharacterized protein involved in cysteine biosynthesis
MRRRDSIWIASAAVAALGFRTSSPALAQGVHDWGMWFGTLVVIAVVALLVALVVALVRRFRR